MASKSVEVREAFHLVLLKHLGVRLSGRSYAVKGGICLRFFHRSPRLSEDMDLDIASRIRLGTLENAVDGVLSSRALGASLVPLGIASVSASKPKQTETTQRWKIALSLAGGGALPTKLEFSRRRDEVAYAKGVPDAGILGRHRVQPFAAQYYDAGSMAVEKISALAAPQRNALRDLFDLHHLLHQSGARPPEGRLETGTLEAAAEKVAGFRFRDFEEQVLPYLSEDLAGLYTDAAYFEKQKREVERFLLEALR